MPDFELYYERMMTKGSRVNMFYCWLDYKSEHPNGYQSSQFYEYFNRFIEKNYGGDKVAILEPFLDILGCNLTTFLYVHYQLPSKSF